MVTLSCVVTVFAFAAGMASASTKSDMEAVCGPQTSVSVSSSADVVGTLVFDDIQFSDDGCYASGQKGITAVKFCGPGSLSLSRMTCKRHDYKAHSVIHDKTAWTTNCEVINVAGLVVEGHMGSMQLTC
eukprot:TRINITY_DN12628_c0_g1_i1.p1 TRINITY_DN12628_c0_g1~~TRINITY_DN12628_c0_g1_i1.p1  ORF type:complete len:129 (-),score=20.50 TRINITY_DN12628_c0_g1_i1:141-527(-)